MQIYYWFLFVIVIIIVSIPTLIVIAQVSDEKDEAGSSSYLTLITCVLSGLIPIVGNQVVTSSTTSLIWKIVLLLNLIVGFACCIRFGKRNKHFWAGFILTLALTILPYVIYGEIVPTEKSVIPQYFDSHFPMIFLTFWGPLFLFGILFGYVIAPKYKNYVSPWRNHVMNDFAINNYSVSESFTRMLKEQEVNMRNQMKAINALVEQIQMQALLAKYPKGEYKVDSKVGALLSRLIDDVAILKSHASQYEVNEINIDQEMLVRELTHFIATPLATIDASCKALQSLPLKGKEHAKLVDNFDRIVSAVNICNGILSTYREIFAGGKIEEGQRLSELIRSSFDVYMSNVGKNLKLNMKVNDSHEKVSNYYIMSMILPLVSNAVVAAKPNSSIEIMETDGLIRISNTYIGELNVSNFEKDGYSSKGDNHRGMGLFTVRHLLARRKLGNLNYYLKENRIYFEVPITTSSNEQVRES